MTQLHGYIGGLNQTRYITNEAGHLAMVIGIRDRIRTAFDLAAGVLTKVGDVFSWQGVNALHKGHAFQIRHCNGAGVPTGHEWTIIIPWYGGNMYQGYIIGANNATNILRHFQDYGKVGTASVASALMVYYSDNADLTARYTASGTSGTIAATDPVFVQSDPTITGIVDTVTTPTDLRIKQTAGRKPKTGDILEVASGPNAGSTFTVATEAEARFCDIGYDDFDTMAMSSDGAVIGGYNPYTVIDDFFPDYATDQCTKGALLTRNSSLANYSHFDLRYDDVGPSLTINKTYTGGHIIDESVVMGKIIEPAEPGDLDIYGALHLSMLTTNLSSLATSFVCTRYGTYGGGGGVANFDIFYNTNFVTGNEFDGAGDLYRQRVIATNAFETKGHLLPDICFVAGGQYRRVSSVVYDGSKYFQKVSDWLCTPSSVEVGLPVIRWDLEDYY